MALAYLLDPNGQRQNIAGVNNVGGFVRVYLNGTDDRAVTYRNFEGALNPADIPIDNNGRCVVIADDSKTYRVEVYAPDGSLLWTQYPLTCLCSGGGSSSQSVSIVSSDGSLDVAENHVGSLTQYDLSVAKDSSEYLEWARCSTARNPTSNVFYPIGDEGSTLFSDNTGLILTARGLYHVSLHMRAVKTAVAPYYGSVGISVHTDDATPIEYQSLVDSSLGLAEEYEISGDIKVGDADTHVFVQVDSSGISGVSYEFVGMDVHRVFSGLPRIPGLDLAAGANISLTKSGNTLTISATGNGASGIPEAPNDGNAYVRKNGQWVLLSDVVNP